MVEEEHINPQNLLNKLAFNLGIDFPREDKFYEVGDEIFNLPILSVRNTNEIGFLEMELRRVILNLATLIVNNRTDVSTSGVVESYFDIKFRDGWSEMFKLRLIHIKDVDRFIISLESIAPDNNAMYMIEIEPNGDFSLSYYFRSDDQLGSTIGRVSVVNEPNDLPENDPRKTIFPDLHQILIIKGERNQANGGMIDTIQNEEYFRRFMDLIAQLYPE